MYESDILKGSLSFVPHGTRDTADVASVLADEHKEELENGSIVKSFDLEANHFSDMILLGEDDDGDDDEMNELIDAAIDELDV